MEKQFFFSTKALIMDGDKFLAVYKMVDGDKWWDLPGGRMEFGETAEGTLFREVKEELAIEIKPIKLIDTWSYMPNQNFYTTGVIYHCEIISGDIEISTEHDGYEWVCISDIGKVFTRASFVERMKSWNWVAVLDKSIAFR